MARKQILRCAQDDGQNGLRRRRLAAQRDVLGMTVCLRLNADATVLASTYRVPLGRSSRHPEQRSLRRRICLVTRRGILSAESAEALCSLIDYVSAE
jgi:hypothetical protein